MMVEERRGFPGALPRGGGVGFGMPIVLTHPGALHGLLLGVSRTTVAWEWSGRPELEAPSGRR